MRDLRGARVAVIGAGVLGLASAICVLRCGADVTLYGCEDLGDTASAVAAGMLAPAFEATLDFASAGHFPVLSAARDLWPAFLETLDGPAVRLNRSGAVWAFRSGDSDQADRVFDGLINQGARAETLSSDALARLHPSLSRDLAGGVYTPDDWGLDPATMLQALAEAYRRLGGKAVRGRVEPAGDAVLFQGAQVEADQLVLAVGPQGREWLALAPELAVIELVKGQILHLDAPPIDGPAVRGGFGYVAPQPGGAIVGATMEVGLADRHTDPATLETLKSGAAELFPELAISPLKGRAGVRASTPDGLPMVGPSSRPGLLLALGARRNGWLLAPMVGQRVADCLLGQPPDAFTAALHPLRPFADRPQPWPRASVAAS